MKLYATIFTSKELQWKIRISPRQTTKSKQTNSEIISTWSPENVSEANRMLMYNPSIGLIIRNKFESKNYIIVPIHMMYGLINILSVINNRLDDKKLYTSEGNHLYLDAGKAVESSVKISCFSDSIYIVPSVMEVDQQDLKAVQIKHNSTIYPVIGTMTYRELHQVTETLRHMDFQTYSIILAMLEKIITIDTKIDQILDTQTEILRLLRGEGIKSSKVNIDVNKQTQKIQSDFSWEGVPDSWEVENLEI